MRCLWLTLADPEPRYNGQFVYSGGLIDSVAATGSEIEVLGLGRAELDSSERLARRADRVVAAREPPTALALGQPRFDAAAHCLPLPHRQAYASF